MRRASTPLQRIFLLMAVLCASTSFLRAIDGNINQVVWKMLYGVTEAQMADPLWLEKDDDGDGETNGAELLAGTNPFSAPSAFRVMSISQDVSSPTIMFPTLAGKWYSLQFAQNLSNSADWLPTAPPMELMGNGSAQVFTPAAMDPASGNTFYRISVQDVDSDSDNVSDWAEKVVGFDPNSTNTHNSPENDHDALANDLLQENVVTISAAEANATQPPDAATLATDTASITITRGGTLHFSSITVPITVTGTGVAGQDFAPLPSFVTFPPKVGSITLTITPLANPNQLAGTTVTITVQPGGGYQLGRSQSASVLILPSGTPTGTGLTGQYFNGAASTVSPYNPGVLFAGTPTLTRVDAGVDFTWGGSTATSPGPGVNATNFGVRWQGQVQPQYSETYFFSVLSDDGVKLWVNGQLLIDSWKYVAGDRVASISLQAGVLYDIKLEYYQATGGDQIHLSWYSENQTKQPIPRSRLYPSSAAVNAAAPSITSSPQAVGFVNQPFAFSVTASLSGGSQATFALGIGSAPLPPGLGLNGSTGLISGTPTVAGDFQIALTASNGLKIGASVLNIQIVNAGSGVTRELWPNLAGSNISDIPPAFGIAPQPADSTLFTLEDASAYGNNTGERLRGYFIAPVTGNYFFWLAASNTAELWISNDAEPVNLVRRAWVTAPGSSPRSWSEQTRQKSPWLALVAGRAYYYEVLHNTGSSGDSSHVSVSFLQDSTGAVTIPSSSTGAVPGYLLSRFDYPTTSGAAGDLYGTNLSPQGTAVSKATGSANLRLLPGNSRAILHFNYSGLSSSRTAYHIHISPDNTGSGPIIFDLDDVDKFHPELITPDGGYVWDITDSGAYTAAQIVSAIQNGTTYFNVHTVNYPNGEIRGFLTLVNGSQKAPVLVPDPGYEDDHGTDAGAARFLNHAAYGAAPADVADVKAGGYAAWINSQMALPKTRLLPDVMIQASRLSTNPLGSSSLDNAWWRAAVTAPDQLRQRMAFALSQILVVSDTNATLGSRADGLASYYDMLADYAFGNFRDLLKAATLNPTMGYWLNMQGNAPGNLATGYHPNENYAREIMQLFSIGLNRLWPDGSQVLDSQGNLVPTYDQGVITNGFARVFTGWTWSQPLQAGGQLPTNFYPPANYISPMVLVKKFHELGTKSVLDNVVLPAAGGYNPTGSPASGSQADSTSAAYDSYCLQDLEKGIDSIFYHPNVAPYICRQLIQRLVHSNPSPAYLHRVVRAFEDDGSSSHVRGNLAAVVTAILLDGEARDAGLVSASRSAGKQREPLLRITGPARTFLFQANSGSYSQSGSAIMNITTTSPHRFIGLESVFLDFGVNATGTPPALPANNPYTGNYTVLNNPAPTSTTFSVSAAGVASVSYSQAAGSTSVLIGTNGPPVGEKVYLKFLTGGLTDGIYSVATVPDSSHFTVNTDMTTANVAGTVVIPRINGYYTITNPTGSAASTITMATLQNTNVSVGDHVWLQSNLLTLRDAEFVVASVIDERHFTVTNSIVYRNENDSFFTLYPLIPPPLGRSGNVSLGASKFDMGNTNGQITQTPMNAPTVFNYFYPDYQYPGSLSANQITTPEFQITTDSNIITLTNTIASTILQSGNTNGLSNFKGGAINLDLGPYMGSPYVSVSTSSVTSGTKVTSTTTTTVDATALVNKLSDILTGGMLTQGTKTTLVNFLNSTTSFPPTVSVVGTTTSPPAAPALPTVSARDKVRAAVQLILVSPEYAIQK